MTIYSTAVRIAQLIFEDLRDTRVLLIGSGEKIQQARRHFATQRPLAILLAGDAELPAELRHFDIVVTSTAAARSILGPEVVARATRARRHKPIFMVDLAVPREIDPLVGRLPDVFLYSAADLQEDIAK